MINILLVEDNPDYRKLIHIHLTRAGYQVTEAADGIDALQILDHTHIHLMIADVMMPRMDGFTLTELVRSSNPTLPILLVTAKDSLEDKREGFRGGADDYMTKPIDMEELLLRIEALLRRAKVTAAGELTVGNYMLNEATLQITCRRNSDCLELRQKEFQLLYLLLSYPGKIFTRQNLMDEIWGYDSETDSRTVDVHIKRLREKTRDIDAFEIQTIRGLGYKAVILA